MPLSSLCTMDLHVVGNALNRMHKRRALVFYNIGKRLPWTGTLCASTRSVDRRERPERESEATENEEHAAMEDAKDAVVAVEGHGPRY